MKRKRYRRAPSTKAGPVRRIYADGREETSPAYDYLSYWRVVTRHGPRHDNGRVADCRACAREKIRLAELAQTRSAPAI